MINKFANLDILEYDFAQGTHSVLVTPRLRSGTIITKLPNNQISTLANQHPSTSLRASISTLAH